MSPPLRLAPPLRFAVTAGALLLLAGCLTSAGDARLPKVPLLATYAAPVPTAVGGGDGDAALRQDAAWWRGFDDPVFNALVAESLAGNPGLQEAASRVREARALARSTAAAGRPSLGLDGSARVQSSQTFGDRTTAVGTSGSAGLDLGLDWVPDLFGGQRREEQAAEAEALRQDWLRRQTGLALVAETAQTYLALRSEQTLQEIAEESLALQRQTLELVRGRAEAGLAPQLDFTRAQAAVASLEAELAPSTAELQRLRNALTVLAGEPPGAAIPTGGDRLAPVPGGGIPILVAGPPIGLPTDLLRRRPDLRAAEAALARATAEIGVAEAAFYPTLRLPGNLALSAAGLGTGAVVQTVLTALGAALNMPLLDGGGRQAGLDAAQERALQAALSYRAALLAALQDVEAALLAQQGAQAQLAALRITVDANALAFQQADTLYRQGLASFLDVLDAQRALNDSRRREVQAATATAQATMAIYAAAGLAPELPSMDGPPVDGAAAET